MLANIYGQPIPWMVAEIMLAPLAWALVTRAGSHVFKRRWPVQGALLVLGICVIARFTLLCRNPAEQIRFSVTPLQLLWQALKKHELFRSLLLNILLFTPFGAALVHLLPEEVSLWKRLFLASLIGMIMSIGVEFLQFLFSLGNAEADDVICNTLGTWMGALSLPLEKRLQQKKG